MKKYVCPNCGKIINEIRFDSTSFCKGVTTKCKKCGKIIEIKINLEKTIDKKEKK